MRNGSLAAAPVVTLSICAFWFGQQRRPVHLQVREARMAAHADAEAVDQDELLALKLQHPPDRELVVYDDI